jgi:hypothetical protein
LTPFTINVQQQHDDDDYDDDDDDDDDGHDDVMIAKSDRMRARAIDLERTYRVRVASLYGIAALRTMHSHNSGIGRSTPLTTLEHSLRHLNCLRVFGCIANRDSTGRPGRHGNRKSQAASYLMGSTVDLYRLVTDDT